MDRIELKKIFDKNNVPKELYSLEGGLPSETYCINKIKNGWETYYSERGNKSNLIMFESESQACLYLKDKIEKIINFNNID